MTKNKVATTLETEIIDLKKKTGSIVSPLQEENSRALETDSDLKKAQEIIKMLGTCKKL